MAVSLEVMDVIHAETNNPGTSTGFGFVSCKTKRSGFYVSEAAFGSKTSVVW
jgi:hypothetical protein